MCSANCSRVENREERTKERRRRPAVVRRGRRNNQRLPGVFVARRCRVCDQPTIIMMPMTPPKVPCRFCALEGLWPWCFLVRKARPLALCAEKIQARSPRVPPFQHSPNNSSLSSEDRKNLQQQKRDTKPTKPHTHTHKGGVATHSTHSGGQSGGASCVFAAAIRQRTTGEQKKRTPLSS